MGVFIIKKIKIKTKISILGGISKFLELIVFGQFWANFAALVVVDNMPELNF
jgi:hypothetical protein